MFACKHRPVAGRLTQQLRVDAAGAGYELIWLADATAAQRAQWGPLFGPMPGCRWGLMHCPSGALRFQARTLTDLCWRWRRRAEELYREASLLDMLVQRCVRDQADAIDALYQWRPATPEAPGDELPELGLGPSDGCGPLPRRWRAVACALHRQASEAPAFADRLRLRIDAAVAARLSSVLPSRSSRKFRQRL